jgi:glycosyltransferase involved in cell wall biosynthesis
MEYERGLLMVRRTQQRSPQLSKRKPRIAIVHHWFVTWGGGESVAETLANLFPSADIFTLIADPEILPSQLRLRRLRESFLGRIPGARRYHRYLLPLYPLATARLDLTDYDLILSSDSGPIKGVITHPNAIHICYCHSPMRYLWDQYHSYTQEMKGIVRTVFTKIAPRVREWDFRAAQRVTHFLANSNFVAARIRQSYGRESSVIYPGIHSSRGKIADQIDDAYLFVGRLVPYKRVDLLIEACNRLKRRLRIIGVGPEEARLRAMAGNTVEFLGWQDADTLWQEYARCRGFLFAAEEDCGMVTLEAQACGRPVIAYGRGGSLETVVGFETGKEVKQAATGVFFPEQSVEAVVKAILSFESVEKSFLPFSIQQRARSFDISCFSERIHQFVRGVVPQEMDLGI